MPDVEAQLSSFADLAEVLSDIPVLVRGARRTKRLSIRAAAEEMGLSPMTVQRLETGGTEMSSATLRAVLLWLDGPRAVKP